MTIPVALIFYIYSLRAKNEKLQNFSLIMLIGTAATVIPVFYTGEPAEEIIEGMTGISKKIIHDHEEAAEIAFVLTLIAGGTAAINLFFKNRLPLLKQYGDKLIIFSCIIAIGFLVYAASKGGKISHPELRESTAMVKES
jgi:hypothetical protein